MTLALRVKVYSTTYIGVEEHFDFDVEVKKSEEIDGFRYHPDDLQAGPSLMESMMQTLEDKGDDDSDDDLEDEDGNIIKQKKKQDSSDEEESE